MEMNKKTLERFWKKIDKKSKKDCWAWTAAKDTKGYGAFRFNKRNHRASRIMYELANGEFDEKLFVCHTCDNPSCVNPAHLFLGTNSDNMKDAYAKGRINPVPPINSGWRVIRSKNKELEIKIIKNAKNDFTRKSKLAGLGDIKVLHSRFKAKGSFLGIKLRFTESKYTSRATMSFGDGKGMVPANRKEYGTDFVTADGKLAIMRFKMNSKGERVITEFEVLGGSHDGK